MESQENGVSNPSFIQDDEVTHVTTTNHFHENDTKVKAQEETAISKVGFEEAQEERRSCRDKVFRSAAGLVIFLSWAATIQGMTINGFVNVVISSLEQRFGLASVVSGQIAGFYDLGSLLAVIPISYFGGRSSTSKPKYIAIGLFVMGTGSLLFSLPHFITDVYLQTGNYDNSSFAESNDICNISTGAVTISKDPTEEAEELISYLRNFKYFFLFGQFLHGMGAAPMITLGTVLLDESVDKISAPLYIGIFQTFLIVGPAIGYVMGGSLLSLYVDFDVVNEIPYSLTSSDSLWIGSWWLCFIISWLLAWACAFFLSFFPRSIHDPKPSKPKPNGQEKGSRDIQLRKISRISTSMARLKVKAAKNTHSDYGKLKDLPKSILALLRNPTYIFISIGSGLDGGVISGLSTFSPKFVQFQYGYSAGLSATLVGLMVVPAGGLGTFFGGWMTKRFRLNRVQILKMYIACQAFTIPASLGILFYCPNPDFTGITVPYNESSSIFVAASSMIDVKEPNITNKQFSNQCNKDCSECSNGGYMPVCGADDTTYFNPCYAGCRNKEIIEGKVHYTNCTCIPGELSQAVEDTCKTDCQNHIGMFFFVFIFIWFTFMSAMPSVIATLRYVDEVHRSLALGIGSIILRITGTIPGPVLYGKFIDLSCLMSSGNCVFYDNFMMAIYLLALTLMYKVAGLVCFSVALWTSKYTKVKDDNFDTTTGLDD